MTHTNNTSANNRVADTIKVVGNKNTIQINWDENYKEWHLQNNEYHEFWQYHFEAIDSAKLLLTRLGDTYKYMVYND